MSKPAKTEQAALPINPTPPMVDDMMTPWRNTVPRTTDVPAITSAESLIAKAIDAGVPIETMERLLAMRTQLKAEQAKEAYFAALASFQGECPVIPKTKTARIQSKTGASFSYQYAPLDVIVTVTAPLLQKHGLSVDFDTESPPGELLSLVTVHHVGGHSETKRFKVPIDREARMNDVQKVAAAATYAKRQNYQNALGILSGDEDNDAQGVEKRPESDVPTMPITGTAPTLQALWDFAKKKGVSIRSILAEFKREEMKDLTAIERVECMQMLLDTPDPVGDQP